MRRWLSLFLLLLLPLQLSWAAVAPYCAHEPTMEAAHFGHHAHEEHAQAAEAGAQTPANAALDADCGHCHGHCVGVLPAADAASVHAGAARLQAAAAAALRAPPPTPPERPQWAGLA